MRIKNLKTLILYILIFSFFLIYLLSYSDYIFVYGFLEYAGKETSSIIIMFSYFITTIVFLFRELFYYKLKPYNILGVLGTIFLISSFLISAMIGFFNAFSHGKIPYILLPQFIVPFLLIFSYFSYSYFKKPTFLKSLLFYIVNFLLITGIIIYVFAPKYITIDKCSLFNFKQKINCYSHIIEKNNFDVNLCDNLNVKEKYLCTNTILGLVNYSIYNDRNNSRYSITNREEKGLELCGKVYNAKVELYKKYPKIENSGIERYIRWSQSANECYYNLRSKFDKKEYCDFINESEREKYYKGFYKKDSYTKKNCLTYDKYK